MITKLPYGLKDGKLLSIKEVQRGLSCGCICPSCKSKLVAKKGEHKIHHFAHHSENNCINGIETALHLAAKEIIEQEKQLVIPPLKIKDPSSDYDEIILADKRKITFSSIELEVTLDDIKPDIIISIGSKKLLVEIAVTHFVDKEKYEKIKNKSISTIEIDLSSLKDNFTHQQLKENVIHSINNKTWIYNKRTEELTDKYFKDYERQKLIKEEEREEKRYQNLMKHNAIKAFEKENEKRAFKNGFDKISFDYEEQSYCPMKIRLSSLRFQHNEVIMKIREGKKWNGTIYGKGFNGRYVFIGREKIQLFDSNNQKTHKLEQQKLIYGQLKRISKLARIHSDECQKCSFFGEFLTENPLSCSCKFRKEKNLT